MIEEVSTLEARLNHFDLNTRTQALQALLEHQPPISTLQSPNLDLANMHCHTFFSFNG